MIKFDNNIEFFLNYDEIIKKITLFGKDVEIYESSRYFHFGWQSFAFKLVDNHIILMLKNFVFTGNEFHLYIEESNDKFCTFSVKYKINDYEKMQYLIIIYTLISLLVIINMTDFAKEIFANFFNAIMVIAILCIIKSIFILISDLYLGLNRIKNNILQK